MGYYNRYFPVGLGYLCSFLRKTGHECSIYNADFSNDSTRINYSFLPDYYDLYLSNLKDENHPVFKEIINSIEDYKPDIIGITVMTPKVASAFKIAGIIKKYNPEIKVVFGGNHPTVKSEEVMINSTNVDAIIIGEGEKSFSKLIDSFSENRVPENIDGVSYRNKGFPAFGKPSQLIENLDILPFPTREFLDNDSYTSEDLGIILTSRGCPYGCYYCSAKSIWGKKIRFRTIGNVMEELDLIIGKYGIKHLTIKDDIFTIDRVRLKNFCNELLSRKMKLTWECNSRADLLDKDSLKLMHKSGCNGIKIGVEAGDDNTLRKLRKNITIQKLRDAGRILKKSKIHWTGYFMMGIPTQTKEEVKLIPKFMKQIKPDFASLSVYEAYPGTELFELGLKTKILKNEMTLADFFSTPPNQYYLKEREGFSDVIDKICFRELEVEIKNDFHKYNRSLYRIFKRILSRKALYLNDIRIIVKDIRRFIAWYKS